MNADQILALISTISTVIIKAAPLVMQAEQNAEPFAEAIVDMIKGNEVTDADIDTLLAKANAISAKIQAPDFIPPQQADDI